MFFWTFLKDPISPNTWKTTKQFESLVPLGSIPFEFDFLNIWFTIFDAFCLLLPFVHPRFQTWNRKRIVSTNNCSTYIVIKLIVHFSTASCRCWKRRRNFVFWTGLQEITWNLNYFPCTGLAIKIRLWSLCVTQKASRLLKILNFATRIDAMTQVSYKSCNLVYCKESYKRQYHNRDWRWTVLSFPTFEKCQNIIGFIWPFAIHQLNTKAEHNFVAHVFQIVALQVLNTTDSRRANKFSSIPWKFVNKQWGPS